MQRESSAVLPATLSDEAARARLGGSLAAPEPAPHEPSTRHDEPAVTSAEPNVTYAGPNGTRAEPSPADATRVARGDARMKVERLLSGAEAQAVEFLERQHVRNVQMLSLIRDHGVESPANRGAFYGCLDDDGRLVGVALVGHWVLLSGGLETVAVFGRIARFLHRGEVALVLGEEASVSEFARVFSEPSRLGAEPGAAQLLLAREHCAEPDGGGLEGLRPADVDEAEEVGRVHACAHVEMLGTDPRERGPEEFAERVRRRIRLRRVWILRDEGGIGFKADIASETERTAYLEAVWLRPDLRGRGLGARVMRDLCRRLLARYQVVCLLADARDPRVLSFYRKVGFQPIANYRLIRYAR